MLAQEGYSAAPPMPQAADFVSPYLRRPLRPLEEVERNRSGKSSRGKPTEPKTDGDEAAEDKRPTNGPRH